MKIKQFKKNDLKISQHVIKFANDVTNDDDLLTMFVELLPMFGVIAVRGADLSMLLPLLYDDDDALNDDDDDAD